MAQVGARDARRLGHRRRLEPDLQLDVEGGIRAMGGRVEIGQRLRVFGRPRERDAEGRERVHRDDPRRDGGAEVLGQEGAERLVLPGLDVAGAPVVEQREAEGMLVGLVDGEGLAQRIAGPDEQAQLQLAVDAGAGLEHRCVGIRRLDLALGPAQLGSADDDGAAAAVVADGHPLVVGQQRVVRAKQAADGTGMVDAGVEVGVVADVAGQRELGLGLGQELLHRGALFERVEQPVAQCAALAAGAGHQRVEVGDAPGGQVEDLVADADADTPGLQRAGTAEAAERQVLQREVGGRVVGRGHPGTGGGVVGMVKHS
mmetsp:Transcript_4941/g.17802  ORF Transcript_4941/g.17802 Transcript_4941/m.17802 type:complete len:315 (+) Transcript_4941:3963-4907(+)